MFKLHHAADAAGLEFVVLHACWLIGCVSGWWSHHHHQITKLSHSINVLHACWLIGSVVRW
jgi:hypothetical protein